MQQQILSESQTVVLLEIEEEFVIPNNVFAFVEEEDGKKRMVTGAVKGKEVPRLVLATKIRGG